jgi:predicted thioesterase
VGGTVRCRARIIQVDDRKVDFQVEARDAHELIARSLHKRTVIRTEGFTRRVQAKVV